MDRITSLFGIKYPIIQGGMVWCSGWRLASAVSNAGGLGLLGAGSMHPDTLREHIQKCRAATHHSFGVNIPLMYPQIEEVMQIVAEEGVRIVFTSAGNPKSWTGWLKEHGITVVHVVSSSRFAMKAEAAGVDAIVAEGFEAGGHNGHEETTTLCLIPSVRAATTLPLIAESSASRVFKEYCLHLKEGDTRLLLKKLSPVRLARGNFQRAVEAAEAVGATEEELRILLSRGRAKRGIFEGDLEEGELEIGQAVALLHEKGIQTVGEVMHELITDYQRACETLAANIYERLEI